MSHTLGLPSIDDFLFHQRASRLTPPWPESKGCVLGRNMANPPATRHRHSKELIFPLEETIYSNKRAVRRAKTDVVMEYKEIRGQADLSVVLHWGYNSRLAT